MLINKTEHMNSLSRLWNTVFGDDYSFIELIFKKEYDNGILCFAAFDNKEAVSAFYLIKNTLKFNRKQYEGYYLYAAATLPEYRGKGFMSELIEEAKKYCADKGADFITLVPSQESLYGYYSRFGFEKAMYRCESSFSLKTARSDKKEVINNGDEILRIRNCYEGGIISFHPSTIGYALDCFRNADMRFLRISDDSYLLYSDEEDSVSELVSSEKKLSENVSALPGGVNSITSPFELDCFKNNVIRPYGMIYPVNRELERAWKITDIYMNMALD